MIALRNFKRSLKSIWWVQKLIDRFLNPERLRNSGVFAPKRIATFLQEYRADTDPTSLVRKDALLNHLLGIQILQEQFIEGQRRSIGFVTR